jgi:amino acid adenylation domain-containing protein
MGDPLSPCQRRIWFLDQLSPGSFANHVVVAYDVLGELDLARLSDALGHVAARHEVLRTRFLVVDGQPMQVVEEVVPGAVDRDPLAVREVEDGLDEAIGVEARRLLDLEHGPPFRITLLRQRSGSQVLVLNLHHMISDGNFSATLFFRDLAASYGAIAAGASRLAPLPLQYRDFAAWQNARCRGTAFEARLEAYARGLGDAPAVLDLPFSASRPAEQTFAGRSVRMCLPSSLAAAARELGRATGGSLLTALTATFEILLHVYTRQTTVVVAVPVPGRDLAGSEGLVGYFGNPVVHRLDVEPGATLRDLLRRVAERMAQARSYGDVPFDELVRRLDPARDASRSPIFQFLLEVQAALPHLALPGAALSPREIETGIAPYDLLVSVTEGPEQVLARFDYNQSLFDGATISRVAGHFLSLLAAMAADPDTRASDVCLPDAAELRLLRDWGVRPAPAAELAPVHRTFEERARQWGDAPAIELGGERLGYRDLNVRANRLARCLIARGVGPGRIVAILMDRSLDAVAALLAISKAGGAFVALDPDLPAERLRFLLVDSEVSIVLADGAWVDRLGGAAVDVLCPDRDAALVAAQDGADLPYEVPAASLAYLIYTSGSTGQPKAIAMPHACLSNLVAWQRRHPRLSLRARTLQFAPFHFDIAYQELFTTWDAGGTLVLVPQAVRRDAEALLEHLARFRVERLYLPYAALENLARAFRPDVDRDLCLREIITAGEQLTTTPALARLLGALGECTLYNQYGPSECHVVTLHELAGPLAAWPALPPIGRPIDGAEIHLVNEAMVRVPVGVPGEVLLGGAGLCRGYLGRPGLTAEKFVPDPFGGRPGACLYRTGDLARFLPDGALQFLGRIDDQVKIRGFRVEPGEVESLLREHPSVTQALVLAERNGESGARLVAYVVPAPGPAAARPGLVAALRIHLERKLPEYMVPAKLLVIDVIPLKVTGKIDRAALGRLGSAAAVVAEPGYEPPATRVQAEVAEIWRSALRLDRVGANDHFFKLGGHSLLATQVVAALRTSLGVTVPLAAVFQLPTLASFAAYIEAGSDRHPPAVPSADDRAGWEVGEL